MKFFEEVRSSIYRPVFYRDLIAHPEKSSWRYFTKFMLALTVSVLLFFSFAVTKWWATDSQKVYQEILSVYPRDLIVEFRDGAISINQNEPYRIAFPEEYRQRQKQAHLLTIDTGKDSIDTKDFEINDTMFLLSRTQIGIFDASRGKTEIHRFSEDFGSEAFTLNAASYGEWMVAVWRFAKIGSVAALLLSVPIMFALFFVWNAFYMLFGALVVWLAAKLRNVSLVGYGQAYQLGLRLITVPIIITFLFGSVLSLWPFVFSFIVFVVAYANFKQVPLPSEPIVVPEQAPFGNQTHGIKEDPAPITSGADFSKE
jgi:hypothetical protein